MVLDSSLLYKDYLRKVWGNSPICTYIVRILFSVIIYETNMKKGKNLDSDSFYCPVNIGRGVPNRFFPELNTSSCCKIMGFTSPSSISFFFFS